MASTHSDKLSRLVKQMRGQARITEANMAEMLREVRLALLEADVALPVVRDFIARVKEKALGQEVVGSLTPGQALVGVVQRELAATMGDGIADINLAVQPPAVILMAGLQGAGKTTTTGPPPSSSTRRSPRRPVPSGSPAGPSRSRWTSRMPRSNTRRSTSSMCSSSTLPAAWRSTRP